MVDNTFMLIGKSECANKICFISILIEQQSYTLQFTQKYAELWFLYWKRWGKNHLVEQFFFLNNRTVAQEYFLEYSWELCEGNEHKNMLTAFFLLIFSLKNSRNSI